MDKSENAVKPDGVLGVAAFAILVTFAVYYLLNSLGPGCHCGDIYRHERAAGIFIVLTLASIAIGIHLIRRGTRKFILGSLLLLAAFVALVMYQAENIDNCFCSDIISTGFNKIKPFVAGCSVKADGSGYLLFTNGAGITLSVDSVEIKDLSSSSNSCAIATKDITSITHNIISPGETFQVTLPHNCFRPSKAGDLYNVKISIVYTSDTNGQKQKNMEIGTIRGPYE